MSEILDESQSAESLVRDPAPDRVALDSSVLVSSTEELDAFEKLLDLRIPDYRLAYSDRTCWVMACLAELAYVKFDTFLSSDNANQEDQAKLEADLAFLRFDLERVFARNGTEAILVANDRFLALAFRGTESSSIEDIKADTRANTVDCATGGRVHAGFKKAFEEIFEELQETLNQERYRHKPLLITGHSLGGALASLAAKRLRHAGGIAGCYTFGSPRVGNEQWISNIKAPVYRLVNAADCVTMLPPRSTAVAVISWLVKYVPVVGDRLQSFLSTKLNGYMHAGNMRYLTNCPKGDYSEVRLLYSVSLVYRLKAFFLRKLPRIRFVSDHSISIYRKKLQVVASYRNS